MSLAKVADNPTLREAAFDPYHAFSVEPGPQGKLFAMAKGQSNASFQLPKDALKKASIGQSFAEYDLVRAHPTLFVLTAYMMAAVDPNSLKSFFVGRRGNGKSSISSYLSSKNSKNTLLLIPQLLAAADQYIPEAWSP